MPTKSTKYLPPLADYPQHSRIHPLKTFNTTTANCFVKRDDELGFAISGSKLRKYLSLIPYLLKEKIQEAVLIGGAYSNHIQSLSQLLIENNIQPTLFLLGNANYANKGNLFLTRLLVAEKNIHWINRKDWPSVELLAQEYVRNNSSKNICIIPEGAFMAEALPGAITLALDIIQNETDYDLKFDHIFIDAGTGLMAIAAILVFAYLEKDTCTHVLLLADEAQVFTEKLNYLKKYFYELVGKDVTGNNVNYQLHYPTQAKSFGSTNVEVFKTIQQIAREEGFLTDPIYSAKLFYEARLIIQQQQLAGNVLIVHSGGGLSLMGFQEKF